MAFLDEEEALAPPGGGEPPHRRVRDQQRQIMVRRAVGAGVIVLLLILIVFMGMGATVLGVVQGTPTRPLADARFREGLLVTIPPLVLLLASLVMGVAMPAWVRGLVQQAADYVGGAP